MSKLLGTFKRLSPQIQRARTKATPYLKTVAREAADISKEIGQDVAKQATASAIRVAEQRLAGQQPQTQLPTARQAQQAMESVPKAPTAPGRPERCGAECQALRQMCKICSQILSNGKCVGVVTGSKQIIPVKPSKPLPKIPVAANI